MSRYDDIPEVFRRAMEDAGWRGDDGDNEEPTSAHPIRPWWTNRWLWVAALVFLLIASFNLIVDAYTEWLWFQALEFEGVWLKQWGVRLLSFLIFFIIAAAILLVNWHVARRRALRPGAGVQMLNLPGIGWLITGAALFMAFIMGQAAALNWESFLRYVYSVQTGIDDPIFEQDVSFYLFDLPVYRFLQGWLMPLLVVALLGVAVIYVINNLPDLQRRLEVRTLPRPLRPHAAVLLFFFFLLWAFGYWINVNDLLFSPLGVAFGASYTDLHATLPALWIQMGLMILIALGMAVLIFRPEPRPVVAAGALWLLASIIGGAIYPGIVQRYVVEPNELTLETPYLENNIAFTQLGFGLNELEVFEFDPGDELEAEDVAENETALRNIRLWDYRPLQQTYAQLQELRTYYEFSEIDVDRYNLEGGTRQVMLAARELNKARVENRWVNQRLEYTHGYGIVMNPVDRVTPQGRPFFYIQDLPPESIVDLEIDRPELYYGEMTHDFVYVNSGLEEFDYPTTDNNEYSHYQGDGGVLLSNWLRRLAFALRFGDTNLVLSELITPETRVMLHRQVQARVREIAPFLWQDDDPYIVAADGRLVWMIDAYTVSNDFPYSQPLDTASIGVDTLPGRINYIRNAVKVTVDAYNGDVNFYVVDPDDPLIQTYMRAFPDLFRPFEEMPATLQEHVRYPEDLFQIQIEQYLVYHMEDVQVFFNKEDLWDIPLEVFDDNPQPVEPYYITFTLPGEEEAEFLLIQPYTPAGKDNMIAWIAARNDPEFYGQLRVYELPKQELVFGPIQVESRVNQDPLISEQFSLWDQLGSNVIRGNLIVVPINDTFLYVEPVYLESETTPLPELKRVIVASGENIVMRETLDEALAALLDEAPTVAEIIVDEAVPSVEEGEGAQAAPTPVPLDSTVQELVRSANAHIEAADAALREGDWVAYGREQEALRRNIERLLELTRGGPEADAEE